MIPTDPEKMMSLPPIVGQPTDQHAQLLFAMGEMKGELKGMRIEMEGLKENKILQNGRVEKLERRATDVEKWQATSDGVSATWAVLYALASAIVAIVGTYYAIHHQ